MLKKLNPIIHVIFCLAYINLNNQPLIKAIKTGTNAYSIIHVLIPLITWFSVSHNIPKKAPFHGPNANQQILNTA